ncbi:MAG TPA: hypothetical protein VJ252_00525 [Chthoniobacterales bacterium]|jgi:hypothetical protein|nr:hypothetical protein [Chthoniobacterales bacterium]
MQKAIATLLIVISATVTFAAEDFSAWINYTSPKGHYSVLIPHEPTLTSQETTTATGEKLPQYLASAGETSATYLIGYFDHTAAMSFSLDKARDGMVGAVKGTLLSESSISLGGSPGRELKISATGEDKVDYIIHARFYHVANRVYCIQFIIPKPEDVAAAGEKMNRYFDSFKVVKAP